MKKKFQFGKTDASYPLRLNNIDWIKSLDRINLEYKKNELRLLIYTSSRGERIYIQYPGKETKDSYQKPNDFRPKLEHIAGLSEDMTFGDVFDMFYEIYKPLNEATRKDLTKKLAFILYRLASMYEHVAVENPEDAISIVNETPQSGGVKVGVVYKPFLAYKPDLNELSALEKHFPKISLEAFLYYLDLLALNEDVKYLANDKPPSQGRPNTIRSVISFLMFLSDDMKISEIVDKFTRTKGVCAASYKEASRVCGAELEKYLEAASKSI